MPSRPRTRTLTLALLVGLLAGACASPDAGGAPDAADTACRPPIGADDPHPVRDGSSTGNHPAFGDLAWLEPLQQALAADHGDVHGGLWLDQASGEVVVMLAGEEPGEILRALRDVVSDDGRDNAARVVCMQATYSEVQLLDLQARIASRATGPSSSGVDTVRNRVVVEVETGLDALEADLESILTPHERGAVELSEPACAQVVELPPGATALPGGGSTCSGMDALLTGTLVVEDGCAWLRDDQGNAHGVAWPRGWYLASDGTVHDHHGEARAAAGEPVASGGGFGPDARGCGPSDQGRWVLASLDRLDDEGPASPGG